MGKFTQWRAELDYFNSKAREAVEKRAEVRREYLGEKPDKKEKESTIFLKRQAFNRDEVPRMDLTASDSTTQGRR